MESIMENFKKHLVVSMNDDVYSQLKDYLNQCDIEDEDYRDTLDFIANNLTGQLQWVD